jgi:excisionase family DNA binding protein
LDPHSHPHPVKSENLSTAQAANLLGVSLGTVQQMVENGVLQAWKTVGGHRRIPRESVQNYLAKCRGAASATKPDQVRVLIAEDEHTLQVLYQQMMTSWGLPLKIEIVDNGFDGLVSIGLNMPDVLIVDLLMPAVNGFDMIRTLRANAALAHMDIIVITGLDAAEIEARGGLPRDVTCYPKPIPFHELRGYFQAKLAEKQKHQRVRAHTTG